MSSAAQFSWDEMVLLDDLVSSGEVKLGRGNVISKIDIRNNPGTYPIYSSSSKNQGKMGEYGSFMFDEELISWSVDGGGYVFYRPKHKFSVTNVSGYMKLAGEWDYKFVAYVLQFQHEYFSFDYQTKAHPSVIREFYLFPRIPLAEQQKIAAILSSVDDVIEKTRAQIDKLKDLKTGMMQELLTKGIGHTAFKDSPVGRIPEGWLIREVQDILEDIIDYRGKSPPKSEKGIPLITAKNIRQGYIDAEPREFIFEEQYESWMVRGTPKEGDVFITTEAPLGNVAKVPGYKFAIGQRVLALSPSSIVDTDYLLYVMQGRYFREQLDLQSTGSTVAGIKQSTFRKILLAVPPLEEQKEIVKPMNALVEREELSTKKLDSLLKLKKALMQDLLTGKVRVNVDNNHLEERVAV